MMAPEDVKPGLLFRHTHFLDTTWKPGPGQKYKDAPKAVCKVTCVTRSSYGSTVYYTSDLSSTRGQWHCDLASFCACFSKEVA